ncbi:mitochondrial nicotinamide adenine dinucleotide transporter SLC25A51-like [Liolophura sinensis]|uniref:mitochondrial nicotinamide adenine dinucleotide transporter SLC25A51-like n=1 Tax=Liolophura sinensis TaxID=3198878 RepID=UPI003158DCA4
MARSSLMDGSVLEDKGRQASTSHGFGRPASFPRSGDPREFACGWGAALINITVTFPINKTMFRQQLYGVRAHTAISQLKKEGLSQLYRGLLPPLLQKTTCMSIMFGMYDFFRGTINTHYPQLRPTTNQAVAAVLAGFTEAILTPFERVQTLMLDRNYQHRFNNTLHAFRDIRLYGYREFYRGVTPILFRNGVSNMMFFVGRERIQLALPHYRSNSAMYLQHFISGALLGAFISTVFYPVNVVKTKMQSHLGGKYHGSFRTFWYIMKHRNYSVKKLFRGVHLNYTRAFISWGIVNASYELLRSILYGENRVK